MELATYISRVLSGSGFVKLFMVVFCAVASLLLNGCASVATAPAEQDSYAKLFTPMPGKASLYIYRDEYIGSAIPIQVEVGGTLLGPTGPYSYFLLTLKPGTYAVKSFTVESLWVDRAHMSSASGNISVEAGKNYFIQQRLTFGGGIGMQAADDGAGRSAVKSSTLIAASPPPEKFVSNEDRNQQQRREAEQRDSESQRINAQREAQNKRNLEMQRQRENAEQRETDRQNNERQPITAPQPSTVFSLDDSKRKCVELGFKAATEAFGKCVLQLSK